MRRLTDQLPEDSGEKERTPPGCGSQRSKRVILFQPKRQRLASCPDLTSMRARAGQSRRFLPAVWPQRSRAVKSGALYLQMTSGTHRLDDPAEREVGGDASRHLRRMGSLRKLSEGALYDLRREINRQA